MRKLEAEALKELTAREAVLKQAEKAFEGALAVVRERERELPRNIRSRIQLEEALTRARNDHKDLLDALEAAREREADARRAYAEAKAAEGGVRKSLRAATTEAGKAEAKFAGRIKSAGFSDTNHYREARLEDLEIERLAEEIDNHVAGLKAARMRLTRARQSTRRRKRPDLSRLERKAEKAKSKCDEMIARTAGIRKEYKRLADLGKEVGLAERKLKRLDKRYCVAGKIADVANGKNPQGITFQRFVLAALLDDVLSAATDRLKVMSRGRFDLNRAGERGDRRSAGGLDLEVYDSYTGTARPVSTLSGGETFLAALSLALGLADVVQAYAGGIRMETIFVDEGFGSLDPESLDLAVRALMDLQRGNRLVGIISHVPELKERIDVRLEVRTTRRGSSARFVGI
jgi:exonuclease SbcC